MDLNYLKKLVRIVEQSKIDEIDIQEEGLKIRVTKGGGNNSTPATMIVTQQPLPPTASVAPSSAQPAPPAAPSAPEVKYHEIKSPIVGTFYRSPAPDAVPYVEVGQIIQPKTVLCIIEAMKLMNEIESDVSGRIVKILVENGKPVEFNQVLFLIEPV